MKKKVVALTSFVLLSSTLATNALADTYKVKKGDTLTSIATKYKTTVPAIKSLNKLPTDAIYINQVLKLEITSSSVKPVQTVKTPTVKQVKYHTVVRGDSLSKIAKTYKISLNNLRKWNNVKGDMIFPGQKFIVSEPATNSTSNNSTQSSTSPTTSEKSDSEAKDTKNKEYIVKSGDYLGKIASQNGLTVKKIKEINGLNSDLIFVGQKLLLSKEEAVDPTPAIIQNSSKRVIDIAKSQIGVPYAWGGNTTSGFDCSGFIHYVFNKTGTEIGRYSAEGYYNRSFYVNQPEVGDLVFFENTYKKGISHMGIYIGNNEFIHADADKGVTITSLNNSYYKTHFDGFKRFY